MKPRFYESRRYAVCSRLWLQQRVPLWSGWARLSSGDFYLRSQNLVATRLMSCHPRAFGDPPLQAFAVFVYVHIIIISLHFLLVTQWYHIYIIIYTRVTLPKSSLEFTDLANSAENILNTYYWIEVTSNLQLHCRMEIWDIFGFSVRLFYSIDFNCGWGFASCTREQIWKHEMALSWNYFHVRIPAPDRPSSSNSKLLLDHGRMTKNQLSIYFPGLVWTDISKD